MTFIASLCNGAHAAYLALIRYFNWLAAAIGAGAVLLNTAHPEIITAVESAVPSPTERFVLLLLWCSLIEYLVNKAKAHG